jgi:hypothetical protein
LIIALIIHHQLFCFDSLKPFCSHYFSAVLFDEGVIPILLFFLEELSGEAICNQTKNDAFAKPTLTKLMFVLSDIFIASLTRL